MSKVEHNPSGHLIQEQAPIRLLQSEAQAISAAREIAVEIAEIAADTSQKRPIALASRHNCCPKAD